MSRPASPPPRSRVRQVPDCAWQAVEDQTLIVRPRERQLHLLNETGGALWHWLETPRTVDELAGLLQAEFDVEADEARADVLAFLETLREKGLITGD